MRIDPRTLIAPLVGALVLVLIIQNTLGALRASGAWAPRGSTPVVRPESPYARLDRMLAQKHEPGPATLRDPFGFASAPTPQPHPRPRPTPRPAPVEPARPTLTGVIYESNDPRATVRFEGRDFTVRENSLFADFRVLSIRPGEVVVERGGQRMVLTLQRKGD
jgi:hypothetical protein